MVYNLKVGPMSGALRVGKHKIIFGKMYNKQGWYNTDNTALQCARMGKDKKAKRKNKTKMDRMGRKLSFKKSHKKKMSNKKSKGPKIRSKKKTKGPTKSKKKKKGKYKKKMKNETVEKRSKKKRAREKKKEKLKRERDRKKLQRLRQKKKRQKQRLQKEAEKARKKMEKDRKKISKKNRVDQRSRENAEDSIDPKIRNPKKTTKREQKQDARESSKKEKKLTKIWKDWLPLPSLEMQSLLRHRMADCNWEDFSDTGHSNTTHLIPRSDLLHGNIVEILAPMLLNPFDISAEDEASEFEEEEREERMEARIERKFDSLDIAMYDVEADPEERNDLRAELPSVFSDLRERAIRHLANVVEADFPPADFSGHPRNFGGNFSPGWCQPKYL